MSAEPNLSGYKVTEPSTPPGFTSTHQRLVIVTRHEPKEIPDDLPSP